MACVICRKDAQRDLCLLCLRALGRARLGKSSVLRPCGDPLPLLALFRYQDEARFLLHEAKIGCSWRAVLAIERCFLREARVEEALMWADFVVAPPSSLWGRLRGRFDIAGYVGASLAKPWRKPFIQPRSPRFWRWRKRAFTSRAERLAQARFRKAQSPRWGHLRGKNILLVDDVVTTGFTMAELSEHFPGNHLRLLAFAHALNP